MKTLQLLTGISLIITLLFGGCASMNRTQKGAAIGTAGGAATGAVIGRASGNTALGAIIGAAVGGVTGTVIGHQMDKQATELQREVPNATVERFGEGIILELSDKVLFDFNKDNLTAASKRSLDKIVIIFKKYQDTNIEIQGHTDNTGSGDYNMDLSRRRAASVQNYLTTKNISPSRLSIRGFGETAPKYSNNSESERAQNRRVEFLITANEKMKAEAEREASK